MTVTGQPLAGFRLARLEVRNWGTFDDLVWTLVADGRNTLVTGDIGSGKSTIVDAITTLLLPANRISYNKAAGADARERSLRSYVLGYYTSVKNEMTGTTRPIALREATKFSVILGVFSNAEIDATVTLAQVFWMKSGDASGQPERFYVTAGMPLSIAADFLDFGGDIGRLRKRLKASTGVEVRDGFPEYGKDFRRLLGIESEQAMELFHQTVSMKSVGNLTDFVREHMLEPFNAAKATRDIVAHFDHLTSAHEAVLRAKAQIDALTPLIADCGAHDDLASEIAVLNEQRSALRYFFADHKLLLADRLLAKLQEERTRLTALREQFDEELETLRGRETDLRIEIAGHGGDRLARIENEISQKDSERVTRLRRHEAFSGLLSAAGLDPVVRAEDFAVRRAQIGAACAAVDIELIEAQDELTKASVAKQQLDTTASELNTELLSLQQRGSNIPKRQLDLRASLCHELQLEEDTLPFAGELIAVREEESGWEGAAERLLHSFALSILVPGEHYRAVSDWINGHHLGGRIVYYQVPAAAMTSRAAPPRLGNTTLAAKLEVKDTPFAAWLERELASRADLECVETMAQFRRATRAITKAGQIKGGSRHEKDDRYRIDDRSRYVLGWSIERKKEALLAQAAYLAMRLADAERLQGTHQGALKSALARSQTLAALTQTHEFAEIDHQSVASLITDLRAEHTRLKEASSTLAKLDAHLGEVRKQIKAAEESRSAADGKIGGVNDAISRAEATGQGARDVLAEPSGQDAAAYFGAIRALLAEAGQVPPEKPESCDRAEGRAATEIGIRIDKLRNRKDKVAGRIVAAMTTFRNTYPVEASELDAAVEAADGYRELHKRLTGDDLPRFLTQFKTYLNQNTIREIAQFQAQLNRQSDLIKERIDTINRSLVGVDYNPGRYIRLEPAPTPNVDIRDFKSELLACTDGAVSGNTADDQYSEQKFLQVKRLIERFKGREGLTDADQKWTRLVTDVRNWYTFTASERYREDDTEYETYADSGGKSGGQKEKLAYTILAASFVYQFKLDTGRPRTFRFVVIDEAFGRGSDESTRFALRLFEELGIQLLIVTPLQKIHVIEPYVAAVGFVDNPTSRYSRLRTLTIEEYQAERAERARAIGVPAVTAVAVA
jgi:uncharacterized protein YPO0396